MRGVSGSVMTGVSGAAYDITQGVPSLGLYRDHQRSAMIRLDAGCAFSASW